MADEEKQEAQDVSVDSLVQVMAQDPEDVGQRSHAVSLIRRFVLQCLEKHVDGETADKQTVVGALEEAIRKIDELLEAQVNHILHDPAFRSLESTWRGLFYLVNKTETSTRLKLRLLNASQKELQDDLEKAVDKDQSNLFKKVYEEEYGIFGGDPYSCLVGDYYFGETEQDLRLLEKLAEVAAAAHAPFIAGTSPKLFNMGSYTSLGLPRDLAKIFESKDSKWIRFREFRKKEDSRYVALGLPGMLLRQPYGPADKGMMPVEGFNFTEDTYNGTEAAHEKYLWGNAAWALGERITKAFALYGWTAAIRGVEGGGLVEDLPIHTFKTDSGDDAMKGPTEVGITDRREKELNDLGFIGLCLEKNSNKAAFFGGATVQKPQIYDLDEANANARLSAVLTYILAASRFAHYLKVIVREKIGSFQTAESVATYLNRWINQYVLGKDDSGQTLKAQYPLREARVDVFEKPGEPGAYKAVVFLRPHFQLEELTTSIRLVAELPPPAA